MYPGVSNIPEQANWRWIVIWKASQGGDMSSLQTVPCPIAYRYGGIVSLEEKIVSNSPIDWQDMWAKDFIDIVLACKCDLNYM